MPEMAEPWTESAPTKRSPRVIGFWPVTVPTSISQLPARLARLDEEAVDGVEVPHPRMAKRQRRAEALKLDWRRTVRE